ncbi:type II toxin-antitoxin system Phd/YefM family antitoxin [Segnochrobactrum spirostomi]|uniref:Antitoxin n=1 Tax=Segnochrobactrum spirostomi TaxID=2608987 RepID=A0A6A7Y8N3_9HYPH|nr:type II toxin-antitoxin system prevent-host-death family antitoxin [Segnochrobactrum spirostomi]MQT14338.1 type II toxin-antitoxin system prevent-host-death family antitoxin [Segnochrobactrum spirostomi]
MRQVSVTAARSHLHALIAAAAGGEEIVITRRGRPIVRLVRAGRFKVGIMGDSLGDIPDFREPLSEEELALWEGGSDGAGDGPIPHPAA